ncbi:hypothetical protein [Kitasatospora sp. NPDC001132]
MVVTDAGPVALEGRQQAVADLSAGCWRGRWCGEVRDYNDDGWRECDDAVPIVATTLELLAARGPLGPVRWRFGRSGRHSLIEALENPNNRAAYDLRQAAREDEQQRVHQELMDSLVCIDCGDVPEEESTWAYGPKGQVEWTRRPGGRCWSCHQDREDRLEREAEEQLEAARAANAALRPCWTCRGSIGGKEGSELELLWRVGDRLGRVVCGLGVDGLVEKVQGRSGVVFGAVAGCWSVAGRASGWFELRVLAVG